MYGPKFYTIIKETKGDMDMAIKNAMEEMDFYKEIILMYTEIEEHKRNYVEGEVEVVITDIMTETNRIKDLLAEIREQ